jgi:hypothetical protein
MPWGTRNRHIVSVICAVLQKLEEEYGCKRKGIEIVEGTPLQVDVV